MLCRYWLAGLMDIISKKTTDDECSCINTTTKEKKMVVVVVPDDLILEILYRLPLLSVFRFKFVCKSWYSLIFNPADDFWFLKHHHKRLLLNHDNNNILLINNNMVDKKIYSPHNPLDEYVLLVPPQNQEQPPIKLFLDHALSVFIPQKFSSSCRLIDSCNGLLLYRNENHPISGSSSSSSSGETHEYHVFNPITKQCFELPMMDKKFRKGTIHWIHIVFDPTKSLSFKVLLCFAPDHRLGASGIYVYSSSSSSSKTSSSNSRSSWKYITKFRPWNYSHFRPVLLDGFLYLYKSPYTLLCFNVSKDKILFLPLPLRRMERPQVVIHRESEYGCGDFSLLYFGVLGGRIRLIRRCYKENPHYNQLVVLPVIFEILELGRKRNLERKRKRKLEVGHNQPKIEKIFEWTVKRRVVIDVNYRDLAAQVIHIYKTEGAAVGNKKKGEEEEEEGLLFLNKRRNTIISYNLTSKTFGVERNISNVVHSHDLDAFRFTPTLFPFSC